MDIKDAHYDDVTWTSYNLKLLVTRLFVKQLMWIHIKKHQCPRYWRFMRGIHRRPVNSPHKGPVTQKKLLFDDVITFDIFSMPLLLKLFASPWHQQPWYWTSSPETFRRKPQKICPLIPNQIWSVSIEISIIYHLELLLIMVEWHINVIQTVLYVNNGASHGYIFSTALRHVIAAFLTCH